MKRVRILAMLVGLALAASAGALAGVALGDRASERGVEELVISDPALAPDETPALRSPGGFTGFEGTPALSGRVVRVGEFDGSGTQDLQVRQDGALVEVSLEEPVRLLRLGAATSELAAGDIVLVRYEDDVISGVLRVPPGLRSGVD